MLVETATLNSLDLLAIISASIAAWIAGGIWYGVLARHWLAALGKTREELPKSALPMLLSFVADLIMAFVIALALNIYTGNAETVAAGLLTALVLWIGFVLTTLCVNNAFAGRSFMLSVIDAGHWLLAMLVAGAVIGVFG